MKELFERWLSPLARASGVPVVTIALASLMLLASMIGFLLDGGAGSESEQALTAARTFYEQNAEVKVSPRHRAILGADFVDIVTIAYDKEKDRGAGPVFSSRTQGRSQERFEKLAEAAFSARMREFPAYRLGVGGAGTPIANHLLHVFLHPGFFALLVSLIFFAVAGSVLELSWGPRVFGGFCLAATVLPSLAYRFVDYGGGAPLAGATTLVAAAVGALAVRGNAGLPIPVPAYALLPAWALIELLLVRRTFLGSPDSAPLAAVGVAIVLGVLGALAIRRFGDERKLPEIKVRVVGKPDRHPSLLLAERALASENPEAAWSALAAGHAAAPKDDAVSIALFELATRLDRVGEAVAAITPVLVDRLRKGAVTEAAGYWRVLVEHGHALDLPPPALVRLAEGLLDSGHPDHAIRALTRALEHSQPLSTSLARRVVRIGRDLDPSLTQRAAAIALEDPRLDAASRGELEALASEVHAAGPPVLKQKTEAGSPASKPAQARPAPVRAPEPDPEPRPDPIASGIDLHAQGELTDADEFHALHDATTAARRAAEAKAAAPALDEGEDPNAMSIASIERVLAKEALGLDEGEELTPANPEGWNDPGQRPGLTAELGAEDPGLFDRSGLSGGLADDSHLDDGALSLDALSEEASPDIAPLKPLGGEPVRLGASGAANAKLGRPTAKAAKPVEAKPLAPLGTQPLAALEPQPLAALDTRPLDALDDEPEPKRGDSGSDTAPLAKSPPAAASATAPQATAKTAAAAAKPAATAAAKPAAPVAAKPAAPIAAKPAAPVAAKPAATAPASPPPAAGAFGEDELETDLDLDAQPTLRRLKLVVGVPIGAKPEALEVEIEGRGASRVPFDRIEAVAVAAVSGLSEKPVLVVDLVLNWLADPSEPLKIVRFHSNRFDPTTLVPNATSSLDALRRLVGGIVKRSGAMPLPNAPAAAGSPFARYPDAATYEREVLGAIS